MTDEHSPYWAVAVAQTNREDYVATLLHRQGFETYTPKIKLAPKRISALFPSYIIVRIFVQWYPVRWCPGIHRLLMNGDRPARLADRIVSEIKGREVRGIVKLPKEPGLEIGQSVRIKSGTFQGRIAIWAGMTGNQRERVLLDLLGQAVTVQLPLGSVEPIAVAR